MSTTAAPAWLDPALKIIREFEGFEAKAYPDPGTGGQPFTIGWGSTRMPDGSSVRPTDVISRTEADLLLAQQVRSFGAGVLGLVRPRQALNPNQIAALTSWAFNVGLGAVEDSTLRKRMNGGEDANTVARQELPRWNKGGGGVMPGLTRRRAAEVALFTTPAAAPRIAVPAQQPTTITKSAPNLVTISGMTGPTKRPHDFGFKQGDCHLIMNDRAQSLTAWSFDGERLWCIPALARGQGRDTDWKNRGTDTPPGIYKLGQLYDDVGRVGLNPEYTKTFVEYGWQFYDMVELEGQEVRHGRAGVGLHGGGTALGWPGAWAPNQKLVPSRGCIRIQNIELRDKILPLYKRGTVFVSVFQEAA